MQPWKYAVQDLSPYWFADGGWTVRTRPLLRVWVNVRISTRRETFP